MALRSSLRPYWHSWVLRPYPSTSEYLSDPIYSRFGVFVTASLNRGQKPCSLYGDHRDRSCGAFQKSTEWIEDGRKDHGDAGDHRHRPVGQEASDAHSEQIWRCRAA